MKRVLCVRLLPPRRHPGGTGQELDERAREKLLRWCEQFSPTVGLEESTRPASLLLDVTGVSPLFGGEEGLVKHVSREFRRAGLAIRMALADTVGAAWALAHYAPESPATIVGCRSLSGRVALPGPGRLNRPGPGSGTGSLEHLVVPAGRTSDALASLPVEALRLSAETLSLLHELGLKQIGQVAMLSRASLISRLGPELLQRLDQAAGRLSEVIVAEPLPPEVQASWTFEMPTDRFDLLRSSIERLLERITAELAARRRGIERLECRLACQTGAAVQVRVGLYRPSAAVRHLEELVWMRLEQSKLSAPVSEIEMVVTASGPLEYRQQELFDICTRRDDPRPLSLLVDRLSSRLGAEAVVRARLLPDAQPEYAWCYAPLIGRPAAPAPRRARARRPNDFPPRPVQLPALARPLALLRPAELEVVSIVPDGPPLVFRWRGSEHRIRRTWGPERIQTAWWRGRFVARDYYRVETVAGQWFWLFRRLADGQWFLHGSFE